MEKREESRRYKQGLVQKPIDLIWPSRIQKTEKDKQVSASQAMSNFLMSVLIFLIFFSFSFSTHLQQFKRTIIVKTLIISYYHHTIILSY